MNFHTCNICTHMYSFQCVDYLLCINICKHIHLLCWFNEAQGNTVTTICDKPSVSCPPSVSKEEHIDTLIKIVSKDDKDDFIAMKAKAKNKIFQLLVAIQQCTPQHKDTLKHLHGITKLTILMIP